MGVLKQNPRISPKDRNAIKGALRRAFARSDLHKDVLNSAIVKHSDGNRLRVKTWAVCAICKQKDAKSYFIVDHIEPCIPINNHFEDMSLDETVDRMWCVRENLQAICESCHDAKTAIERKAREPFKKPRAKRKKACTKT